MVIEQLEDLIRDIECWHRVRGGLNKKRARWDRKPMVMETLPWVLEALYDYRKVLYKVAIEESKGKSHEWTPAETLEHAG